MVTSDDHTRERGIRCASQKIMLEISPMQARDHQQMKRSGSLETNAHAMSQITSVARQHCGQHGCIFMIEAQERGHAAIGRARPMSLELAASCKACSRHAIVRHRLVAVTANFSCFTLASAPTP